jgi:ATP-dependent Clp protease ATP-binding subunit ClpC
MFERFTRAARIAVKDAETEARELGSPAIEAEHLLLALLRPEAGTIPRALSEAGVDRRELNDLVTAAMSR